LDAVTSSIWTQAPEPGIPEPPAIFSDASRLWLAYVRAEDDLVAVVQFDGVIDHHLSPINDEGLGKHTYARAGLRFYSFNELSGSEESSRWSALNARHWVVSFKDNTLDVVARSAEVVRTGVSARSPMEALLAMLHRDEA
jgi:hypothetical protein